jgi:hypothetical protein
MNAWKHGFRAEGVALPLPHEKPGEFEGRLRQWLRDWSPRNAIEAELVTRAARLSRMLEWGERAEAAHLSRRVRGAQARAESPVSARRLKQVYNLGRKLLSEPQTGDGSRYAEPHWSDDPAVLLRAVEESAEGCRWLIGRWNGLLGLVERGTPWTEADRHRFLRLLGKRALEAIYEPELNATFLAWDVLDPGACEKFWQRCQMFSTTLDPGLSSWSRWRRLVQGPSSRSDALAWLGRVIHQQIARLDALRADHERRAEAEAAHRADLAAFAPGPGLDRLRRTQAARARELHRTLETLLKIRQTELPDPEDDAFLPPEPEPAPEPETRDDLEAVDEPAVEPEPAPIAAPEPVAESRVGGVEPQPEAEARPAGSRPSRHGCDDLEAVDESEPEAPPVAESTAEAADDVPSGAEKAPNEANFDVMQTPVCDEVKVPSRDPKEDERTRLRRKLMELWPSPKARLGAAAPAPAQAPPRLTGS